MILFPDELTNSLWSQLHSPVLSLRRADVLRESLFWSSAFAPSCRHRVSARLRAWAQSNASSWHCAYDTSILWTMFSYCYVQSPSGLCMTALCKYSLFSVHLSLPHLQLRASSAEVGSTVSNTIHWREDEKVGLFLELKQHVVLVSIKTCSNPPKACSNPTKTCSYLITNVLDKRRQDTRIHIHCTTTFYCHISTSASHWFCSAFSLLLFSLNTNQSSVNPLLFISCDGHL